jgi:putative toxin-antitoxin system antitoxin component (TIGR02293 family)
MTAAIVPAPATQQLASRFSHWLDASAVEAAPPSMPGGLFDLQDDVATLDARRAAQLIRTGLRSGHVEELVGLWGLDKKEDLRQALNVNGTSLWRWERDDKPLPSPSVEQILRTMQLQLFAAEVFGAIEAAHTWLKKPHPLLDGAAPGAYANNEFGAQKVRGMLAALKYGGVA